MQGIGGRAGYGGRVQLTQHHILKHMLGHRVVVIQPEAQCTERCDRIFRRDLQLQDIGFRHHRGFQFAGKLPAAETIRRQGPEHLAAEKAGKGAGNFRSGGEVGIQRRVAGVFHIDRHSGRGGILRLIEELRGGGR